MNDGKRAVFSARMSVEAIVVVLVVSVTIGIFTMKIWAGGWQDSSSPVSGKVTGLRHDAMSEASPNDTPQDLVAAIADQDKDGGRVSPPQRSADDTVVRNGITVLSPPLLIPVISADAIQTANGSEILASPRKASSVRKRSHYANRAHTRGQQRVVRSHPFWRLANR